MKFDFESLLKNFKQLFSSQDSKFYLITAAKFTIVPIFTFAIITYSLWTIMEMNYNFFVANGFNQDREIFYDTIFVNINEYAIYFTTMLVLIFILGILISYLAMRAFDHIETFSFELRDDLDQELKVSMINKNKLIYQVSRVFFKYIQLYVKYNRRPEIVLPRQLTNLTSPPIDKVFLIQYSIIVGVVCLASSILLHSFSNELFRELVSGGIELLPSNKIVASFIDSQESLLFNLFSLAIIVNIATYSLIAKSIIKTIDGVSFGLARDMIKVIKGKHYTRLNTRRNDPGQGIAVMINEILNDVFPITMDNRSFEEAVNDTLTQLEDDFVPNFNRMDELNGEVHTEEGKQYSTLERSESKVISMLMRGETLNRAMLETQTAPGIPTDTIIINKEENKKKA